MAMPAASFKSRNGTVTIEAAIEFARAETGRRAVLLVLPPGAAPDGQWDADCLAIYANRAPAFCRALAACDERVAAIVVRPDPDDLRVKSFLGEVRELSSAEGAFLILDVPNTDNAEAYGIRPDIFCGGAIER